MDLRDLLAMAATVIVSLGGGGVIVLGLSDWIGKILAGRYVERLKHEIQQEIESYRTRLKKSEFLFQKEFEATSRFMSLRRDLLPDYRSPEMDWHDACLDFANNVDTVEERLEQYMATYGAALKDPVLERLTHAITQAGWGKFENPQDRAYTDTAAKVMATLQDVEKELHEAVWSQSST